MSFRCLLVGGPTLRIRTSKGVVEFEDHVYCGPLPTTKTGCERTLGPRHPFWHAVTCWYEQGKAFDDAGLCAWTEPPNRMEGAIHIAGNQWMYPGMEPPAGFEPCVGRERCDHGKWKARP